MSSKTEQRLNKKRLVVSYANMSPELAAAFKEKYPRGYSDYMGDIFKVDKPNGTFFYAISLEIPEAIYLIKIDVKIDNSEDESETGENNTFPDDEGNPAFAGEDDSDE